MIFSARNESLIGGFYAIKRDSGKPLKMVNVAMLMQQAYFCVFNKRRPV